jgi:hypothetical protein
MSADPVIRPGDTVLHRPSMETWHVLGVNKAKEKVCVAGWPPTEACLADCELLQQWSGLSKRELEYRNRQLGTNWDE